MLISRTNRNFVCVFTFILFLLLAILVIKTPCDKITKIILLNDNNINIFTTFLY